MIVTVRDEVRFAPSMTLITILPSVPWVRVDPVNSPVLALNVSPKVVTSPPEILQTRGTPLPPELITG